MALLDAGLVGHAQCARHLHEDQWSLGNNFNELIGWLMGFGGEEHTRHSLTDCLSKLQHNTDSAGANPLS